MEASIAMVWTLRFFFRTNVSDMEVNMVAVLAVYSMVSNLVLVEGSSGKKNGEETVYHRGKGRMLLRRRI